MSNLTLNPVITEIMNQFESRLREAGKSEKKEVNSIFDYLFSKPGKRLRPLLLLEVAHIVGFRPEHLDYACAIEYIHNATLAHDDVIDESELRRGKPTLNNSFGNPASILFGDYLFTKAFLIVLESESGKLRYPVINNFLQTVKVMSEGEIKQMIESYHTELTEDNYYNIIYAKTGKLIELACILAPLTIYDEDHTITKSFKKFGHHLGNAFQIIDDLIDYISDSETMGKQAGDDFCEGKITLPILRLFQIGSESDIKIVKQLFDNNDANAYSSRKEHFYEIKQLLSDNGCFDYCKEQAKKQISLAKQEISIVEDSPFKNDLIKIADYILSRME